jgi:hypothetical protein
MVDELLKETRLGGFGSNRVLGIVMSQLYKAWQRMLLQLENEIRQLLVDEAQIVVRLKTFLPNFNLARRVDRESVFRRFLFSLTL